MSENLVEIRCPRCLTLLFKSGQSGKAEIEIVCRKCKSKVYFGGFIFGKPVVLDGTSPNQNQSN